MISPKIDELLPLHSEHSNIYKSKIIDGIQYTKNQKIILLSLVRDCGDLVYKNIETLKLFLDTFFLDYRILLLENDSSDNTKKELEKINNNKIFTLTYNFNRPKFGPIKSFERIKALSEYRNILKDKIQEIDMVSDYIIVLDFDFQDISTDGILNSFGWISNNLNIKAVAGNSFQYQLLNKNDKTKNLWNYDSWAYRGSWWQDFHKIFPAPNNSVDPMLWFGLFILPRGSSPIQVNSAFGGCCIYESKYYCNNEIKYRAEDCEHVCLHYDLKQKFGNEFNLVLNPSQIMLF
jgi:hypothetical protein